MPQNALDLKLLIESDKSVYNADENVNIRIGVRNSSSHDMSIIITSPWDGAKLFIVNETGLRVKEKYVQNFAAYPTTHGVLLTAGSTFYLRWGGDWNSLDNWGFRLVEPGTYTITGIPMIAGNFGVETTTIRSNKLVIKILPK